MIDNNTKLDYSDVLIRPKRSTLKSRSEVILERNFNFVNYNPSYPVSYDDYHYSGIPIMVANMDGVGTLKMADTLSKQGIFTCLVKTYSEEDLIDFFYLDGLYRTDYVAMSIGTSAADYNKLCNVYEKCKDNLKYVCIDVANGYSEHFIEYVKHVREKFPELVIIAGNVVTGEMTQQLIIAGADIVKIGIGPGKFCFHENTLINTSNGYKKIKDIKINDEVLTHCGNYKKVLNTFENKTTELIKINGIICTPDHKFYVVNKSDIHSINENNYTKFAYWLEAKSIEEDIHMLISL